MGNNFVNPPGFHAWIQGILFILSLYHLLLFLQNRKKMFLYYSLFVSCLFYYFTYYGPDMFYLNGVPPKTPTIFFGIQFLAYIFYVTYVREIIPLKKINPKWDRTFSNSRWALVCFILIIAILDFCKYPKIFSVVIIMFIAIECFAIINYIVFYRIKTIPVKLIILGSILYLCLANCSLYDSVKVMSGKTLSYDFDPIIFMEIGAVIECFIFALVIGYKIDEIEKEKNQVQIQLLEKSIEASEMKMTALKAQMNPHFIFNVLNSINHFIIKNDKKSAANYLTKFAKYIRSTLNNSNERTISLKQELASIKRYITLEKLRIHNGFEHSIEVSPSINQSDLKVPPLFLQPYVENAIWHGLNHKTEEKVLRIHIKEQDNYIVINVEDNGIGRIQSSKQSYNIEEKSFGTKITEERIKMLYPNSSTIIEDIKSTKKQEIAGTRVIISLPNCINTAS